MAAFFKGLGYAETRNAGEVIQQPPGMVQALAPPHRKLLLG
jgi:hypothetical protein